MTTKYEFRDILPEELDQVIQIEQICFPPNEACSAKSMRERVANAPETFMVAVDKETGKKQVKSPAFSMGWQQTKLYFVMNFLQIVLFTIRKERTLCSLVLMFFRSIATRGLPVQS